MLFFVLSGANLNLTLFGSSKVGILLIISFTYLIFRVIGKYLGAMSSAKLTSCEPSVSKYLGFTLIPQAGVAIGLATSASKILSESGGKAKEIGEIIIAAILISTLIYELIGPTITKISLVKANEIKKENL